MDTKKTRREFLEFGLKTSIAFPLLATGLYGCNTPAEEAVSQGFDKKLKILILGGTSFLGPHQVAYAIGRGHSITTFTRGKTQPTVHQEFFEQVEQLTGDRKDNLTALHDRKWDAVIDNSGHDAEWTKKSAALLRENCDLYLYTSSTGVFYPYVDSEFKEESEVLLSAPAVMEEEEKLEYEYGIMKANSELEAINRFGKDRTIIVRPTYMIGPADKSDRFIHWPIRLSQGGEVLVPGKANDKVQYLDVRDMAEWMIRLIETKQVGIYNAAGPKDAQNMYSFVEEAQQAFEIEHTLVKIDDYDFLAENNVHYIVPWIMPIGKNKGSAEINNEKAKANGLSFRPLVETVQDTYNWWNSEAVSEEQREMVASNSDAVLAREKDILAQWKAR